MLSRIYTSNICSCSNRSLTSLISKKFQQNYYKVVHSNCITSRNFVSSSNMSKTISYVTDIEGNYEYWQNYVNLSEVVNRVPGVSSKNEDNSQVFNNCLALKPNSMLVYGGDVCDRYCGDIRVISDILQLKHDNGDNVIIIQGNRDLNKLRLVVELLTLPPMSDLVEQYAAACMKSEFEKSIINKMLSNSEAGSACNNGRRVYWIRTTPPPSPVNTVENPDSSAECKTEYPNTSISGFHDLEVSQVVLQSLCASIDQMIQHWQVDKLKWILQKTMGAPVAFEMRKRELKALGYINKELDDLQQDYIVVQSYIDSMLPAASVRDTILNELGIDDEPLNRATSPVTSTLSSIQSRVQAESISDNQIKITYAYQKHANFWNDFHLQPKPESIPTLGTSADGTVDTLVHKTQLPIGGLLLSYLLHGQIAYEPTPLTCTDRDHVLFVHGAISNANIGWLPPTCEESVPYPGASQLTTWCHSMNLFSAKELRDYVIHIEAYINTTNRYEGYDVDVSVTGQDGGLSRVVLCGQGSNIDSRSVQLPSTACKSHTSEHADYQENSEAHFWASVGGYGHPHPSSRLMQYGMGWMPDKSVNPTVIYANYLNNGKPVSLSCETSRKLAWICGAEALNMGVNEKGEVLGSVVNTVITGHQPHGDAPLIIQSQLHQKDDSLEQCCGLFVGNRIVACDTSYSVNTQWDENTVVLGVDPSTAPTAEPSDSFPIDSLNTRGATVSEVLIYTSDSDQGVASPSQGSGVTSTHKIVLHGRLSNGYYYSSILESIHSRDPAPIGKPIADDWWVKLPMNYYHPTIQKPPEYADTSSIKSTPYTHYLLTKSVGYNVMNRVVTQEELDKLME